MIFKILLTYSELLSFTIRLFFPCRNLVPMSGARANENKDYRALRIDSQRRIVMRDLLNNGKHISNR